MLEKLPKYVSLFSIMFFIGAVWFEFLYYGSFGIEIFTYVTFSEIINLFIGFIPMLVLIALIELFFIFGLSVIFRKLIERLNNFSKFNSNERKKINSKIQTTLTYLFIFCFVLVFGPFILSWQTLIESDVFIYMRALACFVLIFFFIGMVFPSSLILGQFKRYTIIFVIMFYVSVYYLASYKLWSIRINYEPDNPKTTIILKDHNQVVTNDSTMFIGKTNNYVFLYNLKAEFPKNSYSTIMKMEDIEKIEISRYVKWMRIP